MGSSAVAQQVLLVPLTPFNQMCNSHHNAACTRTKNCFGTMWPLASTGGGGNDGANCFTLLPTSLNQFYPISSFLCPRAQQSLAKRFPGLVLTRNLDEGDKKEEDVIQEIIIDEFSLLLFNSMDDYSVRNIF